MIVHKFRNRVQKFCRVFYAVSVFILCCYACFFALYRNIFLFRKLVFSLLNNNTGAENCLVVDKKNFARTGSACFLPYAT